MVNVRSGARTPARVDQLRKLFRDAGLEAQIAVVGGRQRIEAAASGLLRDGCTVLAAAGGDGTVSTTAGAVLGAGATLAVLPLGTLNHFARDLRIPLDLARAVDVIRSGKVVAIDVAEVNGRTFLNNSSLGIYPLFVHERERRGRGRFRRWLGVGRAALRILRRFPLLNVRLTEGGRSIERMTPFVFVGNNIYQLEGLGLGSRPALCEGQLCVCVAQVVSPGGLVTLLFRALTGHLREHREFEMVGTPELSVETGRRRVHVAWDGEISRMDGSLHYRIRRGALKVMVPA